jgi:hypothetical protein
MTQFHRAPAFQAGSTRCIKVLVPTKDGEAEGHRAFIIAAQKPLSG